MEQPDGGSATAATKRVDSEPDAVNSFGRTIGKKVPSINDLNRGDLRAGSSDSSKHSATTNGNATKASRNANGSATASRLANELEPEDPMLLLPEDGGDGSNTPRPRRSVQFARPGLQTDGQPQTPPVVDGEGPDGALKDKRNASSLLAKLRALATAPSTTGHHRSHSGPVIAGYSSDDRQAGLETEFEDVGTTDFATDDDADSEGSEAEAGPSTGRRRTRRKSRRMEDGGAQTAPTTPKGPPSRPPFFGFQSSAGVTARLDRSRFVGPQRRSTMPETHEEPDRVAASDDEAVRNASHSPWRHNFMNIRQTGGRRADNQSPADPQAHVSRPSPFRRALTGLQGTAEGGEPSSPWRSRGERGTSLSAAKWRQIKAGIKMMARKPKPPGIDQTKSAELLAELTAGIPAALMVASMFQRDQKGHRRIPVLLEQLKVKLSDSSMDMKSEERHPQFRLELEYGNGATRMKWVVVRSVRDFWTLHSKYKTSGVAKRYLQLKYSNSNNPKFPRFPKSVFPYLRSMRGFEMSDSEEEKEEAEAGDDEANRDRPHKHKRQHSGHLMRRRSSIVDNAGPSATSTGLGQARIDQWPERQRRKLEGYINQMIRYFIFRADSNRLCKFLELSAMGMRLASEGSYHGKEGYLLLQSSKGVDFRKALTPSNVQNRHTFKWFLVRHSYIVCVESPEEMNIYDVFLIDSDFRFDSNKNKPMRERKAKELAKSAKESAAHPQHHKLKLVNSERKLRLFAKTERQLHQFEESIMNVLSTTVWAKLNRFDSFAPMREKVFAQWLVDGRDYMWNVSRAIHMAKDVIYIHDWWLSPELYMRRPAAISKEWRLDRLLQRKAREGVKIYVIMYRNINSAIPIDSEYSKFSLLDLHENVFVQRSPNQMRQGTFFWAHHEKICIVDHMIAFMGGIDLCFGRWDTPKHSVVDNKSTGFEDPDGPLDPENCQLWPGKDYSNPRVQDFYNLDKPYEEMYDRAKVPRMPWHDISMQVVGQPARDLTRHFVQRWNYILRQRKPSRPTPFLLPPPDFDSADLESLGLTGNCEFQVLRSCSMWSMGTPDRVEHSILNAYTKLIQDSEHFVYIENQFFISSSEWENLKIENTIGDALVERIIRAHDEDSEWRAVIVIPLMPGFQNTVDSQDGTSVRLIMQCQYRSICRGESSIFGRLQAEGIEPTDYIQFYSLRSWGRLGPTRSLITEQLYIHAKCMIVDDRTVIIGSANINERSMLGSRDSEVAAVIRDNDQIESVMDGEPYMVGRFAHTLRMRLMREHLGIDVDDIDDDRQYSEHFEAAPIPEDDDLTPMSPATAAEDLETSRAADLDKLSLDIISKHEDFSSFNHDADWQQANNPNLQTTKRKTADSRVTGNEEHRKDVDGEGIDRMKSDATRSTGRGRGRDRNNTISTLSTNIGGSRSANRESFQSTLPDEGIGNSLLPPPQLPRFGTQELGLPQVSQLPALPKTDDTDIGGPGLQRIHSTQNTPAQYPHLSEMKRPKVTNDCMRDPLNKDFYDNIWHGVAENNTVLYRTVFRCMPDNEVQNWKQYKEFTAYSERFQQAQGGGKTKERVSEGPTVSGPPGAGNAADRLRMLGPIGEVMGGAMGDAEKAAGALGNKLKLKDKEAQPELEKVERWVNDAERENAAIHTVSTHTSAPEMTDEKSAVESFPDHPPPSASTVPSQGDSALSPGRPHAGTSGSANLEAPSVTYGPSSPSEKVSSNVGSQKKRKRANTKSSKREFKGSDDLLSTEEAEGLMGMVQGHLVVWPYEWLAKEEQGGNWLYSIDQLAPLEIYN